MWPLDALNVIRKILGKISLSRIIFFPVWLRIRLISTGLELVLSYTKKIIYSIVLQKIFQPFFFPSGQTKLVSIFFSFSYPRKAVYNTMRLRTNIPYQFYKHCLAGHYNPNEIIIKDFHFGSLSAKKYIPRNSMFGWILHYFVIPV